jgi:cell wall-associated NlpC family hydrolase
MSVASWGSKKFDASSKKVYTFDGFTNSAALNLEFQENEGGKTFTAIKGIDTEKLGFLLKLHRDYVDVAAEIKSWKALLAAKKPYPLYIGKKKYGSLPWLLASVDVSEVRIGPHGSMISAAVELGFEEIYQLKPPTKNTATLGVSSGAGSAAGTRTAAGSSGSSSVGGSKPQALDDSAAKRAAVNAINATIKAYDYLGSKGASYKEVLRRLKELADLIAGKKSWTWTEAKTTLISTLTKLISQYLLFAPTIIPGLKDLLNKFKSGFGGAGSSRTWDTSSSSKVATFLEYARLQLGKPYVLGGKGPDVFDCSGLVYYCLRCTGVKISYMTSSAWAVSSFPRVNSISALKAGDVVCFRGHVGIYRGDGTMIDASSSQGKVRISSPLKSVAYWRNNFICGRRVF